MLRSQLFQIKVAKKTAAELTKDPQGLLLFTKLTDEENSSFEHTSHPNYLSIMPIFSSIKSPVFK